MASRRGHNHVIYMILEDLAHSNRAYALGISGLQEGENHPFGLTLRGS